MSKIECQSVVKSFGSRRILDRISFDVCDGTTAILGSSGAGKTTLLRICAGLETPDEGSARLGSGRPNEIRVGFIFQDQSLWPHLTAFQHVQAVMSSNPINNPSDLLERTGLESEFWNLRPSELSGGQRQRVAIARAFACDPAVVLLDEPLTGIDQPDRKQILAMIRQFVSDQETVALYATHSWLEVYAISNRMIVLDQGKMAQCGTPEELYWNPQSRVVSEMTGEVVEIPVQLIESNAITIQNKVRPTIDSETILVRPSQCAVRVDPEGKWLVEDCHWMGHSYSLKLAYGDSRLSVASHDEIRATFRVSLAIDCRRR